MSGPEARADGEGAWTDVCLEQRLGLGRPGVLVFGDGAGAVVEERLRVLHPGVAVATVRGAGPVEAVSAALLPRPLVVIVADVDTGLDPAVAAVLGGLVGREDVLLVATAARKCSVQPAHVLRSLWPVHVHVAPPVAVGRVSMLHEWFPSVSEAKLENLVWRTHGWSRALMEDLRRSGLDGCDALEARFRGEELDVRGALQAQEAAIRDRLEAVEEEVSIRLGVCFHDTGPAVGFEGLLEALRTVAPSLAIAGGGRGRRLRLRVPFAASLLAREPETALHSAATCVSTSAVGDGVSVEMVVELPSDSEAVRLLQEFRAGRLAEVDGRRIQSLVPRDEEIEVVALLGEALLLRAQFELQLLDLVLPRGVEVVAVQLPAAWDSDSVADAYDLRGRRAIDVDGARVLLEQALRALSADAARPPPPPPPRQRKRRRKNASKVPASTLRPLYKSYVLEEQSCHTDAVLELLWTCWRFVPQAFQSDNALPAELRAHFERRAHHLNAAGMAAAREALRPLLCNGDEDAASGGLGNVHHLWGNFARAVGLSVATVVLQTQYECSAAAACRRPVADRARRHECRLLELPAGVGADADPLAAMDAVLRAQEEQMRCYVVNLVDGSDAMDEAASCDHGCTVTQAIAGELPSVLAVSTPADGHGGDVDVDVNVRLAALSRHQRSAYAGVRYELIGVILHEEEHFFGYYRVPGGSRRDVWVRYDDSVGAAEAHEDWGLGPESSTAATVTLLVYRRLQGVHVGGAAAATATADGCCVCGAGAKRGRGIKPPRVTCTTCGSLAHDACTGHSAAGSAEWACLQCQ